MAYSRRQWLQQGFWAATAASIPVSVDLPFYNRDTADANDFVRLNWNENPYGPSDKVKEVLLQAASHVNHYGDADLDALKQQIAAKYACDTSNLLITSGSTEILGLLGQHVGLMQGEIVHPSPTFPTLMMFGKACGASTIAVPLDEDHRVNLSAIQAAITDKTALVFICNPNNPTSTEVDSSSLKAFCHAIPDHIMIAVDEAYIQYSENGEASSVIDLVQDLPNLIVCRTFSKAMGLAGLRIGFAISHPTNINALRKRYTGMEFCTNILAGKAAQVALHDDEFISHVVNQNQKGRDIVYEALEQWRVSYATSATNFIYAESKRFQPNVVGQLYKKDNIKITKWSTMTDHIRISIGKPTEMRTLVRSIKKYIV